MTDIWFGGNDIGTVRFSGDTSFVAVIDGFEITNSDPLIDETRKLISVRNKIVIILIVLVRVIREPLDMAMLYGFLVDTGESNRHTDHIFRNLKIHHIPRMGFSGYGDRVQFINNHVYDLGWPRSGYMFQVLQGSQCPVSVPKFTIAMGTSFVFLPPMSL
ncbi:MAG: hypothetical protein R3C68_01005 [Myxococcota bacterium]